MSTHLKGIAASKGIAIAEAFVLKDPELKVELQKTRDTKEELDRLEIAIRKSEKELQDIKNVTVRELGEDEAEIFSAHLLVLRDPEFIGAVKEKISGEHLNVEGAVAEVARTFITIFENMDNEYMKERSTDIRDVSERLLAHLLGVDLTSPAAIAKEAIVIAEDLTPSHTAQLNREFVKAFVAEIGGRTSHSAIMARSMEIPAVVGVQKITDHVENGATVIIDGNEGLVIIEPSPEEMAEYRKKEADFKARQGKLRQLAHEKTVTKCGKHVELAANIGSPDDLEAVLSNGAEGVGLYRTEFLYMGRESLPDEDEQYNAYKVVLKKMGNKPVVIRTLDIGGDKELPYLELPEEMNPFLGLRAIRFCLQKQGIFRTQLRALLRASVHGHLNIMFPMIATVDEFLQAKQMLMEEKENLQKEGVEVSDDIRTGIMVEIPATAIMAKQFAKEVDFFSIGTNDLIQYTMAVDRMNEQVSYLYQPFSPAILNLIENVISAAHDEGKWVGMCGEMAGDETAIPLLIGLGLDELSMSASSILSTRKLFRQFDVETTAKHTREVLNMSTSEEVIHAVRDHFFANA